MAENNKTLLGYISTAIRDFDRVYAALKNKTLVEASDGDTGVTTSEYGSLINTHLIKVGNLTVNQLQGLSGGVLAHRTGEQVAKAAAVDYTAKSLKLSIQNAGYYDDAASLLLADPNLFIQVTDASIAKNAAGTHYEYAPTDKIIEKVSVKAGLVTPTVDLQASTTSIPTVTVTAAVESASGLVIGTGAATDGAYGFKVTKSATASGLYTAKATETREAGYVEAGSSSSEAATIDIESLSVAAVEENYYIAAGGIEVGEVSFAQDPQFDSDEVSLVDSATEGYAISASVGAPTIQVKAKAGYIATTEDKDMEPDGWNSDLGTTYVKKGSIDNQATPLTMAPTLTGSIVSDTEITGGYEIKASVANGSVTPVIGEGYLKSTDTKALEVNGGEKSVWVAAGAASASISSVDLTGGAGVLSTSGKALTVNLTAKGSGTKTAGYVEGGAITVADKVVEKTLYVKEGSATLTGSLAVSFNDAEDGLAQPATSIFVTEVPDSGDYYSIVDTHQVNVSAGWIESATNNTSTTYYVPRATLKYVETEGEKPNFFQVEKAGFIPSGAILTDTIVGGDLDAAVVNVTMNGISDLAAMHSVKGSLADGTYYEINLAKGNVSDAGYMSASHGTVQGTYYLEKGSVAVSGAISEVKLTGITYDETGGKYKAAVTAKAGANADTVKEGYIKAADVTVAAIEDANAELELDKAVVGLQSAAIDNVEITSGTVTEEAGSKYFVTTQLAGGAANRNVVIATTGAGYTAVGDTTTVAQTLTADTFYIKAGTAPTVSGTGKATLEDNFASAIEGAYTVKIADNTEVSVTGTVAEGYYKEAAETAITGKAGVSGSISVAHGKATISNIQVEAGVEAVGEGGVVIVTEKAENTQYYQIQASLGTVASTKTVTPGYVKNTDVTVDTSASNNNAAQYFIKKYNGATKAIDGTTYHVPYGDAGFGVDADGNQVLEGVIATADSYVKNDIRITLHEDAMGAAVSAELAKLGARIQGNGVVAVAL